MLKEIINETSGAVVAAIQGVDDILDAVTGTVKNQVVNVLKGAGVPATVFGARETTHNKINADLGLPDDPATKALFEFLGNALKK